MKLHDKGEDPYYWLTYRQDDAARRRLQRLLGENAVPGDNAVLLRRGVGQPLAYELERRLRPNSSLGESG